MLSPGHDNPAIWGYTRLWVGNTDVIRSLKVGKRSRNDCWMLIWHSVKGAWNSLGCHGSELAHCEGGVSVPETVCAVCQGVWEACVIRPTYFQRAWPMRGRWVSPKTSPNQMNLCGSLGSNTLPRRVSNGSTRLVHVLKCAGPPLWLSASPQRRLTWFSWIVYPIQDAKLLKNISRIIKHFIETSATNTIGCSNRQT